MIKTIEIDQRSGGRDHRLMAMADAFRLARGSRRIENDRGFLCAAGVQLIHEKFGMRAVIVAAQFLDLGKRMQFRLRIMAQAAFVVDDDVGNAR